MIVKILSHTLFVIRKQFLAELGAFEVRMFQLKTWCLSNMEILRTKLPQVVLNCTVFPWEVRKDVWKFYLFDKRASKLSNAHSLMHFGPLVGYRHWFEVGKIFWIFGNFPLRTLELNWVSNFASLFSQQQFWVKSSTSDSTKKFSRRVIDMVWVSQMFS